ncbi:hypothetical protein IMG5_003840 [Ichthyophthirius multifiliis]|uniref:Transmembrane protein n=1 Tax=Ichthyophthirius multifiliis TaxID=5932 RepID=G0QJB4_ICHMU|nr:hypothetical protein IMG5_003840 [Ichthyophthirius multifiliis]EGR34690.1 hypothetical protein IMG5_003840 [Ichthyophthirius multifiliis]|eukprot:XP_004039994.1 hypothetical protein IMG5_003840 [Ichthyophthirius multifiliis]
MFQIIILQYQKNEQNKRQINNQIFILYILNIPIGNYQSYYIFINQKFILKEKKKIYQNYYFYKIKFQKIFILIIIQYKQNINFLLLFLILYFYVYFYFLQFLIIFLKCLIIIINSKVKLVVAQKIFKSGGQLFHLEQNQYLQQQLDYIQSVFFIQILHFQQQTYLFMQFINFKYGEYYLLSLFRLIQQRLYLVCILFILHVYLLNKKWDQYILFLILCQRTYLYKQYLYYQALHQIYQLEENGYKCHLQVFGIQSWYIQLQDLYQIQKTVHFFYVFQFKQKTNIILLLYFCSFRLFLAFKLLICCALFWKDFLK